MICINMYFIVFITKHKFSPKIGVFLKYSKRNYQNKLKFRREAKNENQQTNKLDIQTTSNEH